MLDTYGYILNVVAPISILGELNNLGMRISNGGATSTIFAADGAGGWRAGVVDKPVNEIAKSTGGMWALEHYHPLVIDTPGAIWAVESVRRGVREFDETLGYSFANAFIYMKVHEIACSDPNANLTACELPCLGADKGGSNCDPNITEYLEFSNAPSNVPSSSPTPSPSSSPTLSPVAVPDAGDPEIADVSTNNDSGSKGDPHCKYKNKSHFQNCN
jgi:hypothetical protein